MAGAAQRSGGPRAAAPARSVDRRRRDRDRDRRGPRRMDVAALARCLGRTRARRARTHARCRRTQLARCRSHAGCRTPGARARPATRRRPCCARRLPSPCWPVRPPRSPSFRPPPCARSPMATDTWCSSCRSSIRCRPPRFSEICCSPDWWRSPRPRQAAPVFASGSTSMANPIASSRWERFAQWWQLRSPRERVVLALLGAAVALGLLWLLDLATPRARPRAARPPARRPAPRADRGAPRSRCHRRDGAYAPAPPAGDASAAIEGALSRHGLKPVGGSVERLDADRWRISLDAVAFDSSRRCWTRCSAMRRACGGSLGHRARRAGSGARDVTLAAADDAYLASDPRRRGAARARRWWRSRPPVCSKGGSMRCRVTTGASPTRAARWWNGSGRAGPPTGERGPSRGRLDATAFVARRIRAAVSAPTAIQEAARGSPSATNGSSWATSS